MTIIWGSNFTVIKSAVRELDPQAFNGVRMIVASLAFLAVMGAARLFSTPTTNTTFSSPARVTAVEWLQLFLLGVVGHVLYQICFIGGLARTSVANGSLMLAITPVLIAGISAVLGYERIGRSHWIGAAVSTAGIYLVVGRGRRARRPGTARRPADVRRGLLLGDLHARRASVDGAPFAGGGHRTVDGARHAGLRPGGLAEAAGRRLVEGVGVEPWPHHLFRAVRAVRGLHHLVCRGPPDRQRPDVRVFEPDSRGGDGDRGAVPGRADRAAKGDRRRGGARRRRVHPRRGERWTSRRKQ